MIKCLSIFLENLSFWINTRIGTLGLLLAVGAVFFSYHEYRRRESTEQEKLKTTKRNVLKAIKKDLDLLGTWLETPYSDSNATAGGPYRPLNMILNPTGAEYTKSAFDPKMAHLFNDEILKKLVQFHQLRTNFKCLLDQDLLFSTSDPSLILRVGDFQNKEGWEDEAIKKNREKKPLTEEEAFFITKQSLMNYIHTYGIGNEKDPNSLHSVFKELIELMNKEIQGIDDEQQFKTPRWSFIPELALFIIGVFTFLSLFFDC